MSRGVILSSQGSGQYVVREERDVQRALLRAAALAVAIGSLQASINALELLLDETAVIRETLLAQQDTLIAEMNAAIAAGDFDTVQEKRDALAELTATLIANATVIGQGEIDLRQAQAQRQTNLLERDAIIDQIFTHRVATAWCADLTEDLTGEVGLIDVGRTSSVVQIGHFIIRPGHPGDAAFDLSRDGDIQPAVGSGQPAGTVSSIILSPGAAVWSARYRTGVITAIDGDECTVEIDPLVDVPGLLGATISDLFPGNQQTWGNVPIEYMTCNGSAFLLGDRVVVAFNTTRFQPQPTVIGFVEEPRACGVEGIDLTGTITSVQGLTEAHLRLHGATATFTGVAFDPELVSTGSYLQPPSDQDPAPGGLGSFNQQTPGTYWGRVTAPGNERFRDVALALTSGENTEWNRRLPAVLPDVRMHWSAQDRVNILIPPMAELNIDADETITLSNGFPTELTTSSGDPLPISRLDGNPPPHIRIRALDDYPYIVSPRSSFDTDGINSNDHQPYIFVLDHLGVSVPYGTRITWRLELRLNPAAFDFVSSLEPRAIPAGTVLEHIGHPEITHVFGAGEHELSPLGGYLSSTYNGGQIFWSSRNILGIGLGTFNRDPLVNPPDFAPAPYTDLVGAQNRWKIYFPGQVV